MTYIGNDIVDLTISRTRKKIRDTRFVERVLTDSEKRMIRESKDPGVLLWLFWAAKETAYKVCRKINPLAPAVPRRYQVSFFPSRKESNRSGVVAAPEADIAVYCAVRPEYVHCVGLSCESLSSHSPVWEIRRIFCKEWKPGCESRIMREAAGRRIALSINKSPYDIEILRKQLLDGLGPPEVYVKGEKAPIDISLSHDGHFIAYAFLSISPDL